MERSKSRDRLVNDLAGQARDLMEAHAFDPLLAELWVELLLSAEPLSGEQVAQLLDLDQGEAEEWLEELVGLGAAKVEQDRYRAQTDLIAIGNHFVREHQLALIEEGLETLAFARDRLQQDQAKDALVLNKRLEDLQRQVKLLRQVLGLFAKRGPIELDKMLKFLEG